MDDTDGDQESQDLNLGHPEPALQKELAVAPGVLGTEMRVEVGKEAWEAG